jgi:hypothetical protein
MGKAPLLTEYTLPVELQLTDEGPLREQVGEDFIGVPSIQVDVHPLAFVMVTERK